MKLRVATLVITEIGALILAICWVAIPWAQISFLSWSDIVARFGCVLIPSLCIPFSFYYNDLYNLRVVKSLRDFTLLLPRSLSVPFVLLTTFYLFFPNLALFQGIFSSTLLGLLIAVGVALPLRWTLYTLMKTNPFVERVLILGTGTLAQKIAEEIEAASHLGYAVVGFVDDDDGIPLSLPPSLSLKIVGPLTCLDKIIAEQRPNRIIVALRERRGRLPLQGLLEACVAGVVVEDGIKVHERFSGKLAIESLTPGFLIFSTDFKKTTFEQGLRRIVSLAVAVVGLLITAPLMALIAVLIKLDSRGPVFFVQDRAGLNGRIFRLIKFRTMHPAPVDVKAGPVWSRDENDRITRVGKWLRKTHLDELPQFFNILRGDMDLIGPRPEMACNIETMTAQIPYYALRMAVRPGVTGWAQVRYGYAVSQEDVTEKMRYDLYYVKHMSLLLDLRILIDTVKIVLFNGASTGVNRAVKETLQNVANGEARAVSVPRLASGVSRQNPYSTLNTEHSTHDP